MVDGCRWPQGSCPASPSHRQHPSENTSAATCGADEEGEGGDEDETEEEEEEEEENSLEPK